MAEIIKAYQERMPAMRFIGKIYTNKDRVNGTYAAKWGEWHTQGWFQVLEELKKAPQGEWDSYIGMCRVKDGEEFQYWIGMFLPENAEVPAGFSYQDFPASELGICWVRGLEKEVYMKDEDCIKRLLADGIPVGPGLDGAWWCMERYQCPRFTTPNENGQIILDYCFFIQNQ